MFIVYTYESELDGEYTKFIAINYGVINHNEYEEYKKYMNFELKILGKYNSYKEATRYRRLFTILDDIKTGKKDITELTNNQKELLLQTPEALL